jgi:formamidopyrimidine-DNA glycosylase
MPELPEVETIVRGLGPRLRGRRVTAVWGSGKPLHLRRQVDLRALRAVAVDHTVRDVSRVGKYIVLGFGADRGVIVHLGMTGRLRVQSGDDPRAPHTHIALALAGGDELRFTDPRRFGWVTAGALTTNAALAALGPDPLTALDEAALVAALAGVRAPIKAFLLDQRRIAGLGNIYVSEALHRAGIHPATPAGKLRRRAPALLAGIRASLEGGIARRGTTLRDYVDAEGRRGENAAALLVYGRAGEACGRCGATIRRRVDGGRATFFCPACQKR